MQGGSIRDLQSSSLMVAFASCTSELHAGAKMDGCKQGGISAQVSGGALWCEFCMQDGGTNGICSSFNAFNASSHPFGHSIPPLAPRLASATAEKSQSPKPMWMAFLYCSLEAAATGKAMPARSPIPIAIRMSF